MKRKCIPFFCLITLLLTVSNPAFADDDKSTEKGIQVQGTNFMLVTLQNLTGKKVTLHLTGGEELTGTLHTVGQSAVHLTELQGKEFFDALVKIDQIAAIIVRAK